MVLTIFLFPTTETYAHGGRKDASGCHTKSSTGEYHSHNGNSNSNSSTPSSSYEEYRYKDSDSNGVNDYEQNYNELAKNIQKMGDADGY